MAREKKTSNSISFCVSVVAVTIAGYILGLISIWAYSTFFRSLSLGFGDGILLLGAIAGLLYTLMGGSIAFAYIKYIREK